MSPLQAVRLFRRLLAFDEEALLEVAGHRWSLVYGVGAACVAGLARNYDRPDFDSTWWWAGPLLSLEVALLTTLVFGLAGRLAGGGTRYVALLRIVLATAPLAWLYALPFALVLGPDYAQAGRGLVLTVVSAWRVAVLLEAYRVLLGLTPWRRALAFLTPLGVLAGLACAFRGAAVVMEDIMAAMMGYGQPRSPEMELAFWGGLAWVLVVVWPMVVGWRRWRASEE